MRVAKIVLCVRNKYQCNYGGVLYKSQPLSTLMDGPNLMVLNILRDLKEEY